MKRDKARFARLILAEAGIKIYQKNVKSVDIHHMRVVEHSHGDYISHRDIVIIKMVDGTTYEVLQETVDHDGNYSETSGKMVTKEVRQA